MLLYDAVMRSRHHSFRQAIY